MAGDITYTNSKDLMPPAGHYSHATTGGGLVFVAGQLPVTPSGKRLTDASFEDQAKQALSNIQSVLLAAGSDKSRLLQVRVYLDDIENWPAFNVIYADWIGDARPARAVVPTPPLHFGVKIEVEATALAGKI
jgi:2-iminobutanoate/2-iminopropanoate deaminase